LARIVPSDLFLDGQDLVPWKGLLDGLFDGIGQFRCRDGDFPLLGERLRRCACQQHGEQDGNDDLEPA
jgi:hypothetical protein